MNRIAAVALAALLAGCSSAQPDLRKTAADETPALSTDTEGIVLVESLKADKIKEWVDGVRELQPAPKTAVLRELARRAIAVSEADEPGQAAPLHKEVEAIRMLTPLPPEPAPADFIDYQVWVAAHQGRSGAEAIGNLGLKAFPSILKLRGDRHLVVRQAIGALVYENIVGKRRWRNVSDEQIVAFCTAELARCPADCRPHYRAMLAVLGDESALDAFPALLNSERIGDQAFAHLLLEGMFPTGSPYAGQELKGIALVPQPEESWRALTRRALGWWEKNHDRLSYDRKVGFWVVER